MAIDNIVRAFSALVGLDSKIQDFNAQKSEDKLKNTSKFLTDNADSIVEYTRITRCEPIGMIDHTITLNPVIPDLMSTLTHVYAVMYSQAFSLSINARINGIDVIKTLSKINPNRNLKSSTFGLESHSLRLPTYNRNISTESYLPEKNKTGIRMTMEAKEPKSKKTTNVIYNVPTRETNGDSSNPPTKSTNSRAGVDLDNVSKFHPNLTTGVNFNVTVVADHRTVEIPISMRILANSLDKDNIISILEAGVVNRTVKERWRGWRSGELTFWKDLVLCRDILRADRANLIKDKTGMYTEITKRRGNNAFVGAATATPSISQVSNILVVSQSTIDEFERVSLKRITNNKVRETLFNATQIMILAIVDPDMETVTLYYHDITVPTTVTFKELKSNTKKGNMDPMEILKAYQMGNGIRL